LGVKPDARLVVEAAAKAAFSGGERARKSCLVTTGVEHFGNAHGGRISSSGIGGSQKGLGQSKPKLEREKLERE
jgi:hypothetical protein